MVMRKKPANQATASPHPIVLIILDGWGIRKIGKANAIAMARKPFFDQAWRKYPHAVLDASGKSVGLPPGYIGNSEVGHTHIGAGRLIPQAFMRINKAIRDGTFYRDKAFVDAIKTARRQGKSLHLMGLLSDGGVHSHIHHLFALLKVARQLGMEGRTFVHCFLDGRDVPPKSAGRYLTMLEQFMRTQGIGEIATISGRYYAMDRDNRWQRTRKAYDAVARGEGLPAGNALDALKAAYIRGETDEFVMPSVIRKEHGTTQAMRAQDGDAILFFNFRPDRARQLTRAFVDERFSRFTRRKLRTAFVCMTSYDKTIKASVAFPSFLLKGTLGEIIAKHGLCQLRIGETEKYAHVTYFLNGGRETPFPKEDRILIPSPKVATYDTTPAMSAPIITRRVIAELRKRKHAFIAINFANPDMVGHTGKLTATIRAIEVIDHCLRVIVSEVHGIGGSCIITADHGNAEEETGKHQTSHTTNPVPCILVSPQRYPIKQHGTLQHIAPTILELLHLPKSKMMVDSLILHR